MVNWELKNYHHYAHYYNDNLWSIVIINAENGEEILDALFPESSIMEYN